jgi:hypothetical protein
MSPGENVTLASEHSPLHERCRARHRARLPQPLRGCNTCPPLDHHSTRRWRFFPVQWWAVAENLFEVREGIEDPEEVRKEECFSEVPFATNSETFEAFEPLKLGHLRIGREPNGELDNLFRTDFSLAGTKKKVAENGFGKLLASNPRHADHRRKSRAQFRLQDALLRQGRLTRPSSGPTLRSLLQKVVRDRDFPSETVSLSPAREQTDSVSLL